MSKKKQFLTKLQLLFYVWYAKQRIHEELEYIHRSVI